MSKQRFRLGNYLGRGSRYYHATFDHITHKVNAQHQKMPTILLKDIFLVDKNDKKIALRKENDFIDDKGRHIVADHLWVKMTKPWFSLPQELVQGDEVFFKAEVTSYKISRDDVVSKREEAWQKAMQKNEQIYKRWAKYTETHQRKNFQASLEKMKQKQKANLEQAKKEQSQLKLVDYTLNHVQNIKVVKWGRVKKDFQRETYNYQQYKRQGYKYSAWLAYRSLNYSGKTIV